MTRQKNINYKTAIKLIKKIIEDPTRAHSALEVQKELKWDYERLSYEYDLLLTAYERLKSRHSALIISLSG